MVNNKKDSTSFAPHNPTDGRERGEWKSRYHDTGAVFEIRVETTFLVLVFFLVPILLLSTWLGLIQSWLSLSEGQYSLLKPFVYGTCGGLLGGIIFSIKWLYHSVAKGIWHQDRRLWRMLTPFISSGLAFSIIVFMKSGLFSAFNPAAMNSGALAFSVGFLVGYFSDTAIAKLAEIAQTLFGMSSKSSDTESSTSETKLDLK